MTDVPTQAETRVFCRRVKFMLGALGTQQMQESESFYLAKDLEDGSLELNLLDYKDEPTAVRLIVTPQELKEDYVFVPEYLKKKSPEKAKEAKFLAKGDQHLNRKEFFSAEYEYDNALEVNPKSVRGKYGKGKALLERGDEEEAFDLFEELAEIKELYGAEYKHTFNSLGIDLRKMNKLDEAVRNYKRALFLDKKDEVLHYNIAHALYKKGSMEEARKHLLEALKIKPTFKDAKIFLANIAEDR